jgi:uncharacterized protein (DUF1778 family)
MAKKMGRPPKSAEDRRDSPLPLRFTAAERAMLDQAAEASGESTTAAWARPVLVQAAKRAIRK